MVILIPTFVVHRFCETVHRPGGVVSFWSGPTVLHEYAECESETIESVTAAIAGKARTHLAPSAETVYKIGLPLAYRKDKHREGMDCLMDSN